LLFQWNCNGLFNKDSAMNDLRPYNRARLWTGVVVGLGLGIILGHLMESYPFGAVIGIVVGLALASRWAKTGLPLK
jgi:F0F1-type ATP synthase assembly protein I